MRALRHSLLVLGGVLLAVTSADAAEPAPQAAPRTFDFGATYAYAWMYWGQLYRPYYNDAVVQFSGAYRFSERFSIGGVGSYSPGFESDVALWRLAAEGRFRAVTTRFVGIWGGAEFGIAMSKYSYSDIEGAPTAAELRPRFAPLFGAGAGIDFYPLRAFSIGLEGRALAPIFGGAPTSDSGPTGVAPVLTMGLTVAGHAPLD